MKTAILAGGLGTRLRSVVADRPKPMAPAAGRPFLEYQIEAVAQQGLKDIVLCTGHMGEQIRNYFGDGSKWGVRISYSVEAHPLGTAGALANAAHLLSDGDDQPVLVLNGDSYLPMDYRAMIEAHRARSSDSLLAGSIVTLKVDNAAAYGSLRVDAEGHILEFREKGVDGPGWINGGVYLLEPAIFDLIPRGRAVSIEREIFPLLLEQGRHLNSHAVHAFFVDIGTPEGYQQFQEHMLRPR